MLNKNKGVSLIITFFIMTIILSVVFGISSILLSQIKTIGNIGDSVVAFYMSDSGIEKTIYFDTKQTTAGNRGICNICTSCTNKNLNCQSCSYTGSDCSLSGCTDCQVTYSTTTDDKSYSVKSAISVNGQFSVLNIYTKGFYKNTTRSIAIQFPKKQVVASGPTITNADAVITNYYGYYIYITVTANVTDANGVSSVVAHIQNPDGNTVSNVTLNPMGGSQYYTSWSGDYSSNYNVDLTACNNLGKCSSIDNINL